MINHVCRKYRVSSRKDSAGIVIGVGPNYDATIYSTVPSLLQIPVSIVTFGMTVVWRSVHIDCLDITLWDNGVG